MRTSPMSVPRLRNLLPLNAAPDMLPVNLKTAPPPVRAAHLLVSPRCRSRHGRAQCAIMSVNDVQ
jgi:hypothetical protein